MVNGFLLRYPSKNDPSKLNKFQDNKSFYCWMTGVDVNYRRLGILTKLMDYQTN